MADATTVPRLDSVPEPTTASKLESSPIVVPGALAKPEERDRSGRSRAQFVMEYQQRLAEAGYKTSGPHGLDIFIGGEAFDTGSKGDNVKLFSGKLALDRSANKFVITLSAEQETRVDNVGAAVTAATSRERALHRLYRTVARLNGEQDAEVVFDLSSQVCKQIDTLRESIPEAKKVQSDYAIQALTALLIVSNDKPGLDLSVAREVAALLRPQVLQAARPDPDMVLIVGGYYSTLFERTREPSAATDALGVLKPCIDKFKSIDSYSPEERIAWKRVQSMLEEVTKLMKND